jgi:hypothetical protein
MGWQDKAIEIAKTRFPQETRYMMRVWGASWRFSKTISILAIVLLSIPAVLIGFTVGKFAGTTNNYINVPSGTAPTPPPDHEGSLSNNELRKRTAELASRMRVFQQGESDAFNRLFSTQPRDPAKYAEFQNSEAGKRSVEEFAEVNNRYIAAADKQFRSEALALRDEMERRLGRLPPYKIGDMRTIWLNNNVLAGPTPISNAADYLEELARTLPP